MLLWNPANFQPYLILRYGLPKEPRENTSIQLNVYEDDSGFVDSLQIVSDTVSTDSYLRTSRVSSITLR